MWEMEEEKLKENISTYIKNNQSKYDKVSSVNTEQEKDDID